MRRRILLIALLLVLLLLPALARAEMPGEVKNELDLQLKNYGFNSWQSFFNELSPKVKALWGEDTAEGLIEKYAEGKTDKEYDSKLDAVVAALLSEVKESAGAIGAILGIALLSGIVGVLLESDGEKELQEVASFVCYGMSVLVVAYLFMRLAGLATEAIERISAFSEAATPVMATLLSAVGSAGSSAMLRPLMLFLSTTVLKLFQSFIVPVILGGGVVAIVGNLSDKPQLHKLFSFSKSLTKWSIGVVFTVYLAILAVQGMSAAAVDSISLKAVKYTLDKTLPVVGSVVSGTFDTVRGCTVLVKNAAGIAAALIAFGYAFSPAVQLGGAALALKLAAALVEPVSEGRIPKMLQAVAESLEYMFGAVVAAALMFMITAGLVVAIGGMAV